MTAHEHPLRSVIARIVDECGNLLEVDVGRNPQRGPPREMDSDGRQGQAMTKRPYTDEYYAAFGNDVRQLETELGNLLEAADKVLEYDTDGRVAALMREVIAIRKRLPHPFNLSYGWGSPLASKGWRLIPEDEIP